MYEDEFRRFAEKTDSGLNGIASFGKSVAGIAIILIAIAGFGGLIFLLLNLFFDEVKPGNVFGIVAVIILAAMLVSAFVPSRSFGKSLNKKAAMFIANHPGAVKMYGVYGEKGEEGCCSFWLDQSYNGMYEIFFIDYSCGIVLLPDRPYNLGLCAATLDNEYIKYYKDVVLAPDNTYYARFDHVTKVFIIEEESASGRRELELTGNMRHIIKTGDGGY